jgi:2-polyprenyl-3-methyl-5-hydroxy-6-metoxy-1,4-benzoquinol methylase
VNNVHDQTSRQILSPGLDYELETVNCCVCGSSESEVYLKRAKELYNGLDAWFDVVRCRGCGHYFTNPRPTAATMGCFYPDSARYYQPKPGRGEGKVEGRSRLRRSLLANYFGYDFSSLPKPVDFLAHLRLRRRLLLAHLPRFVPGGRLLDIGCAWGGYLARMRQLGWSVYGIELNEAAAAHARDTLGLTEVGTGSFDDCRYPDGFFDVIHLSMVLEHLHDPAAGLARIGRMLRPGGQLILSVPDISGFESRLFRDKVYTLQVPQHLHHFTPASISRLLRQSGFRVERILHQQTKADFVKSAAYLEDGDWRRLLTAPPARWLLGPLTALLARLGRTSRMSVFAVRMPESEEKP